MFGLKLGPAGAIVQVFQVRSGRVVERIELETEAPVAGAREGDVLAAAIQQFYEERAAPPEVHVPAEPDERDALDDVAVGAIGRHGPRGGAAARREAGAGRAGEPECRARVSEPLQSGDRRGVRCAGNASQRCSALPAIPRRIECFDISTIQGSETVASMVVCEDGRMQRGEYRKYRIRGMKVEDRSARRGAPVSSVNVTTTSRPCRKSCGVAIESCWSRAGRFPI